MAMAACSSSDGEAPAASSATNLSIVTTIYPLHYLTQRIGGDQAQVANLVPAGTEPHDWEPTPRDIASIHRAKLFVYNGVGLEPWVDRVRRDVPSDSLRIVDASTLVVLIDGEADAHETEEQAGENSDASKDPHVWLDPSRYAQQAEAIALAMTQVDPAGEGTYTANLKALQRDLADLEQEFRTGLSSCKRNAIVTSHAAFGYLADRFGLVQLAVSGLSPEAEPSPARLREIVREVRAIGATHIFFETLVTPKVAQTVAREVGAQTLVLNPLEGLTQEQVRANENYLTLMRKNLANLKVALACQQ
ncbi:MAG: zinc ABC transporter substrate-binding protein [Chloroflexi bacterium]|nr:zinc ABC transporter substrate-binding protein [Chloroflexota bacterium]